MNKRITLAILAVSVLTALTAHGAQAPAGPPAILHHVVDNKLEISSMYGEPDQSLDLTTIPVGVSKRMTLEFLMEAAYVSSRPFCFMVCTENGTASAPLIFVTDANLYPTGNLPEGFTPVGKYKLYAGGTGQKFPPHSFIAPAPPAVIFQQVPIPVPYPVEVEKIRVETIPYYVKSTTPSPTALSESTSPAKTELAKQGTLSSPASQVPTTTTEDLQALLATMQQSTASAEPSPSTTIPPSAAANEAALSREIVTKEEQAVEKQAKITEEKKAQEAAERETEKMRASEAAKKAQEEEKLKKLRQEQEKKLAKQQEEERRKEQARRDKEENERQKAATAAKAKQARETAAAAKKAKEKIKASEVAPTAIRNSAKKKGRANDYKTKDEDILEKAIEQAAAARATLAMQRAHDAASREEYPPLDQASLRGAGSESATTSLSPAEQEEEETIKEIRHAIENDLEEVAKKLLKNINPNSSQYFVFLMNIYLNESHLLTQAEVVTLMTNALIFAKNRKVDRWHRCYLYCGRALHEKDETLKEDLVDLCISLDVHQAHPRARALKTQMEIARYNSHHSICKASHGKCPHPKAFIDIEDLEEACTYYPETIALKISLLAKAASAPHSCPDLTRIVGECLKTSPTNALISYYNTVLKKSRPTTEELAKINSIIPADIIPADELYQLE